MKTKDGIKSSNQWYDLTVDNFKPQTIQYFISEGTDVRKFLLAICESGTLGLAVRKCNLNPIDINPLLYEDDNFRRSTDAAIAFAVNVAEGKLYERGIHGYIETKEDENGQIVEKRHKYSDRALLELKFPKFCHAARSIII